MIAVDREADCLQIDGMASLIVASIEHIYPGRASWDAENRSSRALVRLSLLCFLFFFRRKVVWLNRREICFELWFVFGRLCDSLMRKLRSVHRKVRDCRSERESYISTQSLLTRILYTQSVNLSSAPLTPPSGHTLCLPYKQILSFGLFMVNSKEQRFSRSSQTF